MHTKYILCLFRYIYTSKFNLCFFQKEEIQPDGSLFALPF
jgi:hypothetical protein